MKFYSKKILEKVKSILGLSFVTFLVLSLSYGPFAAERAIALPGDKVIFLTTTGTNTWTVPSDWSNNNNIEVIGGGGGGRVGSTSGSGGGGGGAYAAATVTGLSAGGSVTYRVGTGGAAGTAGGDTFFNRTAGAANTCADTSSVCAKGGSGATSATGAAGGAVASNLPTGTGFAGGAGGNGNNTGDTGGGGGGAAGPNGVGRAGGAGQALAPGAGGGGGANGTANGSAGSTNGGAGAVNYLATGSGTGANATNNTAALAGTNGGGGGGGAATTTVTAIRAGANGGAGATRWTSTHAADGSTPSVAGAGPGGGGGGAGATTGNGTNSTGGNGGLYGGGGGGAYTTAGTGAQGVIVITYTPSTVSNIKTVFLTTTGTNTWTVPNDWSNTNEVVTLGAGGGGRTGTTAGSGGGGGGAFATGTVAGLSAGGSVTYRVGTGGAAGTAGGDTFFNRTAGAANTCADTSSVCAKGGSGATSATGAAGGVIASNKPAYSGYVGGAGGNGNNTGDTGGGGGGAAGPYRAGQVGGAGQAAAPGAGGGGGGVGGLGSAGASTIGGAGGRTYTGAAGGAGATWNPPTAALAGTNGGGGGGGLGTTTVAEYPKRAGANGGNSAIWTQTSDSATIGPGGGGGGAGATTGNGTNSTGGTGGYGAGGGGAYTTGGSGGQGFIIIRYVPSGSAPTVTTQDESGLTKTSATINGNITDTGGSNATARGFAWGTNSLLSGGDTATTTENGSFSTGAFTGALSSLTCNTTYYSRPYATNPTATGYGTIDSFVTVPCEPTVTTQAASSIGATSATGNGNITVTGGEDSSIRGFTYGTLSNLSGGDTATTTENGTFSTGAFTGSLTSLVGDTTYYVRAYATSTTGGMGVGSTQSFLTLPDTPGTPTASAVTATTLTLDWTAPTGGATTYKIERCAGSGCSSWSEIATGVVNVYYDDTGLSAATTYRYRVRGTNATGDGAYATSNDIITSATATFELSAWRFFDASTSVTPGTALANQGVAATLSAPGDDFRMRILLHAGTSNVAANERSFKLQYAAKVGTCDSSFTGENYADITTATAISYYDTTGLNDNSALGAQADLTHGGDTIVNQTYEELNNFSNSQSSVASGQDGKWDFSLYDNSGTPGQSYCIRVVNSGGSVLDAYVASLPEIIIPEVVGDPSVIQLHYRFRNDDGDQNSATWKFLVDTPITYDLYKGDRVRLRIQLSNDGAGPAASYNYRLEHSSTTCSVWLPVPSIPNLEGEHWVMDTTVNIPNGSASADSDGISNPPGKTFTPGFLQTVFNQTPSHTMSNSQFTEHVYTIRSTPPASTGVVYCFRLTNAGSTNFITYNAQPQIILGSILERPQGGGGGGGANFGSGGEQGGGGQLQGGGGFHGGGFPPGGPGPGGEGENGGGEQQGGGDQGGGGGGGGGGDTGYIDKIRNIFASAWLWVTR